MSWVRWWWGGGGEAGCRKGSADGYYSPQPLEHFSLVATVEESLQLRDRHGLSRGLAHGRGVFGGLEGEVASCVLVLVVSNHEVDKACGAASGDRGGNVPVPNMLETREMDSILPLLLLSTPQRCTQMSRTSRLLLVWQWLDVVDGLNIVPWRKVRNHAENLGMPRAPVVLTRSSKVGKVS